MTYGAVLWPILRELLIAVGGWLVKRGATHGARKLATYLYMRAEHFADELSNLRTNKKKDHQRRRIKWYLRASDFMRENAAKLTRRAWEMYQVQAERIPYRSPAEKYR